MKQQNGGSVVQIISKLVFSFKTDAKASYYKGSFSSRCKNGEEKKEKGGQTRNVSMQILSQVHGCRVPAMSVFDIPATAGIHSKLTDTDKGKGKAKI